MRAAELRDMTVAELKEKEKELRKELFNLRFQQATGEIQNPKAVTAARKDIARTLTIITEREKSGETRG